MKQLTIPLLIMGFSLSIQAMESDSIDLPMTIEEPTNVDHEPQEKSPANEADRTHRIVSMSGFEYPILAMMTHALFNKDNNCAAAHQFCTTQIVILHLDLIADNCRLDNLGQLSPMHYPFGYCNLEYEHLQQIALGNYTYQPNIIPTQNTSEGEVQAPMTGRLIIGTCVKEIADNIHYFLQWKASKQQAPSPAPVLHSAQLPVSQSTPSCPSYKKRFTYNSPQEVAQAFRAACTYLQVPEQTSQRRSAPLTLPARQIQQLASD